MIATARLTRLLLCPAAIATARTPVKALRYRSDPPGAAFAAALTEAPRAVAPAPGTGARERRAERKAKTMQATESEQVVSRGTSSAQSQQTVNNHAKQLAEDALGKLAAALESGKSEALVNYLAVMARFHRYSWNNCLLIAMQECVT